ncbi:MAG: DUF2798 domain-containing protein [Nitrospiraceae bacterium]
MIPKNHTGHVSSFLLDLIMSGLMSSIISVVNMGLINGIIVIWLKAWAQALIIAFPTLTVITPAVRMS